MQVIHQSSVLGTQHSALHHQPMPRAERSFRTQAIILKRRDFGEADRLLTRDRGFYRRYFSGLTILSA